MCTYIGTLVASPTYRILVIGGAFSTPPPLSLPLTRRRAAAPDMVGHLVPYSKLTRVAEMSSPSVHPCVAPWRAPIDQSHQSHMSTYIHTKLHTLRYIGRYILVLRIQTHMYVPATYSRLPTVGGGAVVPKVLVVRYLRGYWHVVREKATQPPLSHVFFSHSLSFSGFPLVCRTPGNLSEESPLDFFKQSSPSSRIPDQSREVTGFKDHGG